MKAGWCALALLAACEPDPAPPILDLRVTLGEAINGDVIKQIHVRVSPVSGPEPAVILTSSHAPIASTHRLSLKRGFQSAVRIEVTALDRPTTTDATDPPVLATATIETDPSGKPIKLLYGRIATVDVVLACVAGADCLTGNFPPAITPPAAVSLAEADEATVNVHTSDRDEDTVSLTIDDMPAWVTIEPAPAAGIFKVSFAPGPHDGGAYDFTLRAIDGAATPASATATLHVDIAQTPYVLAFDGLADRLDGGTLTAGAEVTLEAWYHRSASGAPLGEETLAALTAVGGLEVHIAATTGGTAGKLSGAAIFPGVASAYASTDLPADGWHHAALVLGAGGIKLYLDGAEAATGNVSAPSLGTVHAWFGGTNLKSYALLGELDELRVFNLARSAAEVDSDRTAAPPATGLLRHYPLDDGEGTAAEDLSPEGVDATLVGDAMFQRDARGP